MRVGCLTGCLGDFLDGGGCWGFFRFLWCTCFHPALVLLALFRSLPRRQSSVVVTPVSNYFAFAVTSFSVQLSVVYRKGLL